MNMKECIFQGLLPHAEGSHHGCHTATDCHTSGHHGQHPRSNVVFNELVGHKIHQLEQIKGQLRCPELSHTQLQVIRAELAVLTANKDNKHSIKHALHAFYHAMGIAHPVLRNPYVVFGPKVAHRINHLKREVCKVKEQLLRKLDSHNQQELFEDAFRLAFHHLGNLVRDLHDCDLTVKRLEHIKAEVEMVQGKIQQCKEHFYHLVGGMGHHIDTSIMGMAEGLKMQWKHVKELVAKREADIARA